MPEICVKDKVLISYNGETEVYDGVIVVSTTTVDAEEKNELTNEEYEGVDLFRVNYFLLGFLSQEEILAMSQEFIRETWKNMNLPDRLEFTRTLRELITLDYGF